MMKDAPGPVKLRIRSDLKFDSSLEARASWMATNREGMRGRSHPHLVSVLDWSSRSRVVGMSAAAIAGTAGPAVAATARAAAGGGAATT